MNRTARDNRPNVKPVTKVKLKEEQAGIRLIIVVLLVAIAAAAFAYGISSLLNEEPGWVEIEADSTTAGCADEFVFLYELGASDTSATAEKKALTLLYTDTMEYAYQVFNSDTGFEEVCNIYEINRHPNEVLTVDEVLYDAFLLLQSYGNRNLYMAPIYARYDDMFYCGDDSQTYDFDPYQNEDVEAEYQELADFAADSEQVEIKLLGDGKIKLCVSEEYLDYAEENGITCFIDFFWMKNAFITDYLADTLTEKGYTHGTVSSYDGFSRCLDDREVTYSYNLFDREEKNVYNVSAMKYSGRRSIVSFRNYKVSDLDYWHYYEFTDGETRTSYLDLSDGKCKSALPNLVAYSDKENCAQILMEISPVYIAEELDEGALDALVDNGVYSVYCKDRTIYHNDADLCLAWLYDRDGITYTSVYK